MGRKASPLKATLKEECDKRNIGNTGSITQLIDRLEKHEQRETKTTSKKLSGAYTMSNTPTCKYSKQGRPVTKSAQAFVDCFYKGNSDQAENSPEWVMGSSQKIKLMVPAWRNTKGGVRMRWVLFKRED